MLYRVFDAVVASDWPLPELPRAEAGAATAESLVIEIALAPFADLDVEWFHEWRFPGEAPWMAAAHVPGGRYLLRAPRLADFLVDACGERVQVFRVAEVSDEALRRLLLDHVVPLVIGHRGAMILHASGVVVGQGAVLLVARSGSGKSTIAAALGVHGAQVMADDAIALRVEAYGLVAVGSYSCLRLWPDSPGGAGLETGPADDREKRHVAPGMSAIRFTDAPAGVSAIYVLDPSESGAIAIEPLPPRDAVMALVANSYVLDPGDRARLRRHLDCAIACARAVPIRRLAFPHDAGRLEELCRSLVDDHDRPA